MLSEVSYTKWQIVYDSTDKMYVSRIGKLIETENIIEVTRGYREEGMGSYYLMDTEFLFGMMNKFWKWIVVMVT